MTQDYFDDTLGCGPAPEGPQPERPAPVPGTGRARPKPAPGKTRRVGTFTMGVALIVTGVSICIALSVPAFDILLVAKLAPLVLVALGCEILWWSAHQGGVKIKYDFLSMLVCFVLLCASLCAAALPTLWRYYGPDRQLTEDRLANDLVNAAYPALKGQDVRSMSVQVSLASVEFDTGMGLDGLTPEDYVGVNVLLRGPYTDSSAFAAACTRVMKVLRGLEVPMQYVDFYAQDEQNHYDLVVSSIYDWDATPEQLAGQVDHQIYVAYGDGDGYWEEEQNYRLRSAYEEGWELGLESGPEEVLPDGLAEDPVLQRVLERGWQDGRAARGDYAAPASDGPEESVAPSEQPPGPVEMAEGDAQVSP